MPANEEGTPADRTRRWAKYCFGAVVGLCLLVLLSWAAGRWRLGTLGEPYVPMAPSTAISLLGLAAAAWLGQSRAASPATNRIGRTVALAVLATSLLVWARFQFGIELPLVSSVRATETVGQIPVGRMSPLTALAFLLASLGLLVQPAAGAGRKALRQTAAILAVLLLFLSTDVTLSYVLKAPLFYGGTVIPMAALTAAGFTLLGLGLLMGTGADTWPMGLVIHPADGTPSSRRLIWGFFAMVLLLMACVVAGGYAYLRHEQSDARRVAAATVSAVADLKVRQIAEWYRERRADARTIFSTPMQAELHQFMTNPADTEARERMLAWLRAIQQEDDYSPVALVDSHGIVRLSMPSSMTRIDSHVRVECRRALRQHTVVIRDLHREQSDQTIRLSFIIPLVSDRSDGVLLLQIDAARFLFPLVQSWPTLSRTSETLLVRREGNEVVYLNELRHRKGTALSLRLPVGRAADLPAARAVSGEEGVFEGNDYRQIPVVAALRAVPGTPWFVVAKIDREEIYGPFWREVSTTALFLAMLLLAAVSGFSVLWYRRGLVVAERELVLERRSVDAIRLASERTQSLSRHLLEIQETDRRQLARELHDELGQALTATKISLQSLQRYPEPATIAARLGESIVIVDRALGQVRSLSLELRPPLLDDLGLTAALRWLTDQQARLTGLRVEFRSGAAGARFDTAVETACFRVAQEAITNVVRHAAARNVTIELHTLEDMLHLRVIDDGAGFDVPAARRGASKGASLGLLGMEERVTLTGGGIEWRSSPGQGAAVHAWFPLPRPAATHDERAATA